MGLAIWSASLNESALLGKPVSLAIMIMRCREKPDIGDKQNAVVMQEAITGMNPENLACVMTFADQDKKYTIDYAMAFVNEFFQLFEKTAKPIKVPPKENFFLFHGKGATPTKHEGLLAWIKKISPNNYA